MKISRKIKNLAVFLLILNAIVGTFYWIVLSRINNHTNMISSLSDDLNLELSKEKLQKSFKKLSEDVRAESQELDSYFVPTDGVVTLITDIEKLASIAGVAVEIKGVSIKEYDESNNQAGSIETISLKINTNGNWENNFYFLNLLESMPYKKSIESLNINTSRPSNSTGLLKEWEMNLTLEVLKIKEPESA